MIPTHGTKKSASTPDAGCAKGSRKRTKVGCCFNTRKRSSLQRNTIILNLSKRRKSSSGETSSLLSLYIYRAFYLFLLCCLGILVAFGPVTNVKSDWGDPGELPTPTVTVCGFGSRRRKLKVEEHFYISQDSYIAHAGQNLSQRFQALQEWYVAGHLNRELKVFYSEPTWKIEADDWQETRGDGVIGNCYSLDLSQRIDPGQQYVLHLAFNKYHNQSSLTQEDDEQYYLLVREKEDEFSVGSPVGYEHLADGIFIPGAMSHNIMVKPKILQYRKNCNDERTLSECLDGYIDDIFPNCTRGMMHANNCTLVEKSARNDAVVTERMKDLDVLKETTSCTRACTVRRYDLAITSQVYTRTVQENADPRTTKIHLFYNYLRKIRVHKEVKAYGFTEFQAEVGGLSGLLLGLSILDIVSKCGRKFCSV